MMIELRLTKLRRQLRQPSREVGIPSSSMPPRLMLPCLPSSRPEAPTARVLRGVNRSKTLDTTLDPPLHYPVTQSVSMRIGLPEPYLSVCLFACKPTDVSVPCFLFNQPVVELAGRQIPPEGPPLSAWAKSRKTLRQGKKMNRRAPACFNSKRDVFHTTSHRV